MPMTRPAHRLGCIVLAAGSASRFGAPKQLALYRGETLVHRAVRNAYECGAGVVVLVTGANADAVRGAVTDFPSLIVADNPRWDTGLSSSIATGLTSLGTVDCALITLADQPHVESSSLERLISRFDDEHRVIASEYSGTIGVPAIVGHEFFPAFQNLSGDKGAKAWLMSFESITVVPMAEATLDIDTADDLERVRKARPGE